MSLSLSNCSLTITALADLVKTLNLPGASESHPVQYSKTFTLPNGSGTGQADVVWDDERTLAASASETLDLTALTDAFGGAIDLTKVKALLVFADPSNTNDVQVGGGSSNAFEACFGDETDYTPGTYDSPFAIVKPGGMFLVVAPAAGYTVDSTHKLLKVKNSAGTTSVKYDIVVIGVE
jgi:hypothetical protein